MGARICRNLGLGVFESRLVCKIRACTRQEQERKKEQQLLL